MDKKILILILILAAFLRLYRLSDLMVFVGDQGTDYLTSAKIVTEQKFPLMLHETSQKGVLIGPFFYYLQSLALWIGNFDPTAPAVMTAILGVLSVFLMYKLGNLYAAVLFTFSPLVVISARIPIHVAVYPFFLLAYMLALKANKFFFVCLLWLILIQIHLSSFLLIPITLIISRNRKYLLTICLFFLLSLLFAKDTVLSLSLLTVKKIISIITLKNLYTTPVPYFLEIFQKLFSLESLIIGVLFLPFFLLGMIKLLKKKDFSGRFLLTWFFVAAFGLIIKNSPAEHYFNLITPVFFLILAVGLEKVRFIALALLLIFSISNLYFFPARDFYMNTKNNTSRFNYGVPLSKRIEIAKLIVQKASGKQFNIKVTGDFDIYPSTGKNYEYLSFWLKGKPSEKEEKLRYIIYEPKEFAKINRQLGPRFEFENAIVEEISK